MDDDNRIQAIYKLGNYLLICNAVFFVAMIVFAVYLANRAGNTDLGPIIVIVGVLCFYMANIVYLYVLDKMARPHTDPLRTLRSTSVRTPNGTKKVLLSNFVTPVDEYVFVSMDMWARSLYADGLLDPNKVHLASRTTKYAGMLKVAQPAPDIVEALLHYRLARKVGTNLCYNVDAFPTLEHLGHHLHESRRRRT